MLDQGLSFTAMLENWWFSIVFLLGGLFSVVGTLNCILTRLEVEVTSSQVRQLGGGVLRDKTWDEPLSHYTSLRVERRHHPDWIGAKDEFGIHLCHGEDASRSVLLYWGRSERRFQALLSRYSDLLGLGVQGALAARRAAG